MDVNQIIEMLRGQSISDISLAQGVLPQYGDGRTGTVYSSSALSQLLPGARLQPRQSFGHLGGDSAGYYDDPSAGYDFFRPIDDTRYLRGAINPDGTISSVTEEHDPDNVFDKFGDFLTEYGWAVPLGLAGASAAGMLGGGTVGAGEIAAAAGVPELGLAAQTGGGLTASGIASAAGLPELGLAAQTAGAGMNWGSLLSNPSTWLTGAQLVGGYLSHDAAGDAADAQQQSSQAAIDEQRRQYDLTRSDFAPWRETGAQGLSKLADLLGINGGSGTLLQPFTGADVASEPGYQFGLSQGEQGINRGARARGMFDSGAAMKDLLRFNQDYAGTKFNEAFNRDATTKGNMFNWLSGVSGSGQTATGQVSNAGQNMSNNVSNLTTGAGNARAAGIVGGANAINNTIGGVANLWQQNQLLDMLRRP